MDAATRPLPSSIGWLLLLALCAAGAIFAVPAEYLGFYWAGLGGLIVLVAYAVFGDLIAAVLLWFFTLICLHEEFWRTPVPLFFAVTIPRLGIVVLALLLVLMVVVGRVRINFGGAIGLAILMTAVYFTLSAAISGFETRSPVTVHYRLIGGYLFPFTIFGLVLHGFRGEQHLRRISAFFLFIGVYLTLTGWAEQFKIWALVWPRFIADSTVGIHFGRVRGPFVQSAAMGLALIYCYFNNLILARQSSGVTRWLIYAVNVLMLPVIFWTKTRSVWLAFLLCALLWFAYSRRRTVRAVWVSALVTLTTVVGIVNMENFLSSQREKGGFTDVEPILVRLGLAQISFNMFAERPLLGVGFGHFRDHAPMHAQDPSSPFYAFATTAMEHNNFLSIMTETGAVGVVLYVLMLVLIIRPSFQLWRKLPPTAPGFINRDLVVLYWILALAYLTDGFLRETSDNPFANSLFFGLSAAIVALNNLLGPRPLEAFVTGPGAAPLPIPVPASPAGPRARPAEPPRRNPR